MFNQPKPIYERPISRFPELYNSTTFTFQIWLALLAFSLFILSALYRYDFVTKQWYFWGMPMSALTFIYFGIVTLMGIIMSLIALFAFASLVFITIKSFFKRRQKDLVTTQQDSLNDLVKQVQDLKAYKKMIDNSLEDIEDKGDDKP